jgi:hypothetical protein
MMVKRQLFLGRMLAVIAGTAVACTASPPTTPPPTTRSTSASPTTTTSSPAEQAGWQAVEVYLAMWHHMARAARTSDWRSPLLSKYATGDALTTISRGLYADHRNGLVTKGAPKNNPTVSQVEPPGQPTRVTITDCGDSTDWLKYRADTGQPANDGPGGRRAITAVVELQPDGLWRVSDFAVQEVGTC